jgi:hypothetical protein
VSVASTFHVRVENAFLLKVTGHGVLRQKRRLEPDFGADPLALGMGSIGRMVAAAAAAELRAEVRTLNLIKLLDPAPRGVADGAGDIDLKLEDRHEDRIHHRVTERIKSSGLIVALRLALYDSTFLLCVSVTRW